MAYSKRRAPHLAKTPYELAVGIHSWLRTSAWMGALRKGKPNRATAAIAMLATMENVKVMSVGGGGAFHTWVSV